LNGQTGVVVDYDGNTYSTICIGSQEWMAENLKVTYYNDGTDIPLITDNTDWVNDTAGAMCYYDNLIGGDLLFAPAGWHVSTKTEMETLSNYLGGWEMAGAHLKEAGTSNWDSPNIGADNIVGFTALGAGYRDFNANFFGIFKYALFWNSGDYTQTESYYSMLHYLSENLITSVSGSSTAIDKHTGCSVRLIKDDDTDLGTMADNDANVYATIKIVDQVWMAENLKQEHYNDASVIPELTDNTEWSNDIDGAMCWYNNAEES
jgi:uncharacterized protein (TIGR02145 family)